MKIFYLCDRRACEKCNSHGNGTECKHMSDIRHAVNFELTREGDMREKEPVEAELISEAAFEFEGALIDEERLAAIEQSLAKLVDASGKAVELLNVDIKDAEADDILKAIGRAYVRGVRLGFL